MNFFKNILATVDLSDESGSTMVIGAALELLDKEDTLNVVCVVPDFGMSIVGSFFPEGHEEDAINKARDALHTFTAKTVPSDVQVQHIIGHGNIYEEIIDASDRVDADVIVIGSHRPKLRDYLLGPNAARVVRHSSRSVVVVRSRDKIS